MKPKSISTLSVLVIAIVGLSLIAVPVAASGVGTWKATTTYPINNSEMSCVVSGGYVYCVGGAITSGAASSVYFASLSSSGVGTWKTTTSYPTTIAGQSCVVSGGYIYCVGGFTGSGLTTNAVYFAKLSSTGVGTWKTTTSYPTTIGGQSCVVSGGYIYCVAGINDPYVSSVYFASLSSSGVGTWKTTTSYPTIVDFQSCVVSGGYIYCVGGAFSSLSPYVINSVYFAKLSSSGVGTWKTTTNYATTIGYQSCVVSGGYIYCVGGFTGSGLTTNAVYFAKLSSTGVGTWTGTTSYPTTNDDQSCVVSGGYIYCVGGNGEDGLVYFASV